MRISDWSSDVCSSDLLRLEIEYRAHPEFEVDGRNILYVLSVTPWEAALGATLTVPTLGGPVELKVPAGSDAGRKLRLRGRGLPGTPPGDQIIELEIRTRSEERRVGKACVSTCRSRWSPYH